jgi:ankyrin repeat protein
MSGNQSGDQSGDQSSGESTAEKSDVAAAAAAGDVERLRALLAAGADPNAPETDDHWPPLLEAAQENRVEAVRLLLDAGADMYTQASSGETPLSMALRRGSLEVFRLLLERGYQLDPVRDQADQMLVNAGSQDREVLRWLVVEKRIPIDTVDYKGCTALLYAAHNDRLEAVEELLRLGADPNHRGEDGETVLMWAADHEGNAAVLRALIAAGADVHAENAEGTAFYWLCNHFDIEMMQVLLDAGAEIPEFALRRAAYQGNLPAVRFLLDQGVSLTAKDAEGRTALDYARSQGHEEVARLLESKGSIGS